MVEGQRIGARPDFSGGNDDFKCSPSEAFLGQTWCQRKKDGPKGPGSSSSSMLQGSDGNVRYANRFIDGATFGPGEVEGQIARLSKNFGEQAQVLRLPSTPGLPSGVIATWGRVRLVPLDPASLQALSAGQSLKAGLLLDYLGDFRRSARQGQPVFRIIGGPGYIWTASFDAAGRGTLRLTAADLNGLAPEAPPAVASAPSSFSAPSDRLAVQSGPSNAALPLANGVASAAATPPAPVAAPVPSMAPAPAAAETNSSSPLRTVVTQGIGRDVEAAAKNAAENALTQVVGSFVDAEKLVEKRSQINDGIRSESRRVQTNIREYSQGSIRNLEILDTSEESGITRVQAKVTVRVEDFKAYIKRVAVGETTMGTGLFAQIATAQAQQQSLEGIVRDKILGPIASGEVVRIKIDPPMALSDSGLSLNARSNMNPVLTVVFPVEVSIDDAFGQNLVRVLESTASDKLRQQERWPVQPACHIQRDQDTTRGPRPTNSLTGNDTGVKIYANSNVFETRQDIGSIVTETYKLPNARPHDDNNSPKLNFQILGKDGTILWERFFSRDGNSDEKAFVVPRPEYGALFLPWTLVRASRGCVFIARRSKFRIVAELDPSILRGADRASLKFVQ